MHVVHCMICSTCSITPTMFVCMIQLPQRPRSYHACHSSSQISGTSEAGSMAEAFGLTMVSTTPDEQSQVFMVLGQDVSKSVVSSWSIIASSLYRATCRID